MTVKTGFCVAAAAIGMAVPVAAHAIPILGPGGHYYEVIASPLTWDGARIAALGMTHLGQSGYLATVTSSAENSFIAGLLNGDNAWLGGNDLSIPDTWVWADGPEAGDQFWQGLAGGSPVNGAYTNWGLSDPNNAGGSQYGLLLCAQGVSPCISESLGQWIDRQGSDLHNYVVEYGTVAVPEPSTFLLLGFGLAGLAGRRSGGAFHV